MKAPSRSQIDYALHLLRQLGEPEPDWSKMTDLDVSALIDGLKKRRGKPVWYGNGQFSHWEKSAAAAWLMQSSDLSLRVASRYLIGGYFNVGDVILFGKFKNKAAIIKSFSVGPKGPVVTIKTIPHGEEKTLNLFMFRKAPPEKVQVLKDKGIL